MPELVEPSEKSNLVVTPERGCETVLVVEDEDELRELIKKSLETRGYNVLAAPNGWQAIAEAQQHTGPIHVLITDVVMPQMNGLEVAQRITSLKPHIRVLYMSGYADEETPHLENLERDQCFIQKPFPLGALARKLRNVLSSEPARPMLP